MTRTEEKTANGICHIMSRGADRRILFADDQDCSMFLTIHEKV